MVSPFCFALSKYLPCIPSIGFKFLPLGARLYKIATASEWKFASTQLKPSLCNNVHGLEYVQITIGLTICGSGNKFQYYFVRLRISWVKLDVVLRDVILDS
jgi:hypothetical protein